MQNTIIAVVLALVILGGGYYYFMGTSVSTPSEETTEVPTGESNMPVPETGNEGTNEMEASSTTPAEGSASSTEAAAGAASVKTFTVEGSGFKFAPATMEVKKGDTVKITFKNTQGFHDFVIDEFKVKTKQIAAGKEETVEFVADKAGTFEYYCSVGTHRQQGMKGTLTVK